MLDRHDKGDEEVPSEGSDKAAAVGDGGEAGAWSDADDDRVFKALASPVRCRMLDVLKDGGRSTGALAEAVPELDRTTVLQHLRVLERAGLVLGTRVGRERRLTLAPMPIRRIYRRFIAPYMDGAVELFEDLGAE